MVRLIGTVDFLNFRFADAPGLYIRQKQTEGPTSFAVAGLLLNEALSEGVYIREGVDNCFGLGEHGLNLSFPSILSTNTFLPALRRLASRLGFAPLVGSFH